MDVSPSVCGLRGGALRSGGRYSRRVDGVLLRYEEPSVPYSECHEHELVARLQAHLAGQGHSIAAVMEMLRMSMMELFMAVCCFPPWYHLGPAPGTHVWLCLCCSVSGWWLLTDTDQSYSRDNRAVLKVRTAKLSKKTPSTLD